MSTWMRTAGAAAGIARLSASLCVRAYMHVHRGAAGPPVAQGRRLTAVCLGCAALGGSYLKMMNPLAAYNALDEVGYH